jgi:hypothetical protein
MPSKKRPAERAANRLAVTMARKLLTTEEVEKQGFQIGAPLKKAACELSIPIEKARLIWKRIPGGGRELYEQLRYDCLQCSEKINDEDKVNWCEKCEGTYHKKSGCSLKRKRKWICKNCSK